MRLSVHVAARISALCEMFPQRAKTQIINDLLSTALDQLENSLEDTHPWEESEVGLENLPTQKTKYHALVKEHLAEIEASDDGPAVEVTPGGRNKRAGR
jgi:anaerobic glycerol-3-phosphate dehydrogenase